ncbi:hypothetical protein DT075_11250 [Bacillus licheniformis]|nr:hypothetical protein DT075_11250 [Bacillus licheniformis]
MCGTIAGFTSALTNPFTVGTSQMISGLPLYSGMGYRAVIFVVVTAIAAVYVLKYAEKIRAHPEQASVIELGVRLLADQFRNKPVFVTPVLIFVFSGISCFIGTPELSIVYVPVILPLLLSLGYDRMTAAFIPAGEYERVESPDGREMIDPASYKRVEQTPVDILGLLTAVPKGMTEAAPIIVFTFVIGGAFAVLRRIFQCYQRCDHLIC